MTSQAVEYRRFGRADEAVSAIGLGGFHLGIPDDPGIAVEMVRTALDGGITFLDNSWDYHGGESERRMGRALRDGYRERAFLMTKLDSRTHDGTMRQLDESLARLETDHVDLLQLHEVIRDGEPNEVTKRGGVLEAYVRLKEQGVARYIGFTGHKDPSVHRATIEKALERGIVLDSVQMPINPFDSTFRSFLTEVVPLCVEHGIAVVGMKPLGAGRLVGQAGFDGAELLRWSLSQPVTVVVTGCESMDDVSQALDFNPLPSDELDRVRDRARPLAADGRLEPYKAGTTHDGTAMNPHWLD